MSRSAASDGQRIVDGMQPQSPPRGTRGAALVPEAEVHGPGGCANGVPVAVGWDVILSGTSEWNTSLSGVPPAWWLGGTAVGPIDWQSAPELHWSPRFPTGAA
mmetsp:Transcript_29331/g.83831  ORF Transcript_29331/g.83831 Transcript_29331/m.83831 type:complete len:103 (-) Transcript_29331:112-420(-)